jgi:multidrug efflux system membrane fusion protein
MAARRRFRWGFVALGVLAVALVLWLVFGQKKADTNKKAPTVPVATAKVAVQDVAVTLTELGAAQAWQGVVIRTQVNGKLERVPVTEGTNVHAGALLAQIDEAPFRAALTQAQGALARDKALLAQARMDLARYETLLQQNSIARQQAEDQAAVVKQDQGLVKLDEGAVATAEVNLRWCRITAPVAGRVGVRLVDPGNVVSTSDTTGIITVNQITPIAVTFSVAQGDFQTLVSLTNGFSEPLSVEALSQETGASLGVGQVRIADNHVDPSTGTVELKARFENAPPKLWPGQFVNVRIKLKTLQQALVIPTTAVNQGPNGPFAYVVGKDDKVAARPIAVAVTEGDQAVIKTGVKAGETVVVDGQMNLKPGSKVAIHPPGASKKPAQ